MALTKEHVDTIKERAKKDPQFFKEFVKELLREALKIDAGIVERVLRKVEGK